LGLLLDNLVLLQNLFVVCVKEVDFHPMRQLQGTVEETEHALRLAHCEAIQVLASDALTTILTIVDRGKVVHSLWQWNVLSHDGIEVTIVSSEVLLEVCLVG